MSWSPNGTTGAGYSRARVDLLEALVTEAQIDLALNRSWGCWHGKQTRQSWVADPRQRARTRRNIALGLACGSYTRGMLG